MKIKRIYTFMLQTYLPLFVMTLLICLFIIMMQFLWSHIDELVGKGLGLGVLAELFFYASLTMVPLALPLAVLLASLMTFGNLGESLELLAMKSSGISLLRIMKPLTVFIVALSVGVFFFQDDILPRANTKMYSLLLGIKHKSPELEIPEGVFYKEINDYNIYVGHKDPRTGLLEDVTIYIFDGSNIEDATVTVADSGRVKEAPDGQHLELTLWHGEQVGTFKENNGRSAAYNKEHPKYRRESFSEKVVYIPYSNELERTDESFISTRHVGKNLATLRTSVDSLDQRIDSINLAYGRQLVQRTYFRTVSDNARRDTAYFASLAPDAGSAPPDVPDLDSIYASLRPAQRERIAKAAGEKAHTVIATFDNSRQMQAYEFKNRQLHELEIHRKFVLSIGVLIFFFIGAPLGAIIRKGGMGVPIIVSVLFFIVYYLIDTTGNKLAKDGDLTPWVGAWLSSLILAPIGVFLTWRAINDSTLFDWDSYVIYARRAWRALLSFVRNKVLRRRSAASTAS